MTGTDWSCCFLAVEPQEAWTLYTQLFAVPYIQMTGESNVEFFNAYIPGVLL